MSMQTSRRGLVGAIAAAGAGLAAASAKAGPNALDLSGVQKDTDFACAYHCDFGDPQRFSQMLQNMLNHYSSYDFDSLKLKLVLVAHGAGIKFFLTDLAGTPWAQEKIDPDLYKRFAGLAKYGTEAYLCQITYKRLQIDPEKTRDDAFLKFVPSGVRSVAELQAKGFAYIKTG
jgi:intracellular sulfur oxidation DsrE/DsrF family protein